MCMCIGMNSFKRSYGVSVETYQRMSPEIKSKYYTPSQHTQSSNSDGGNVTDKTTGSVGNDDKQTTPQGQQTS